MPVPSVALLCLFRMSADNETWPVQEVKPSQNMAYFHLPPIWVGAAPEGAIPRQATALMGVIHTQTLSMGIKVEVCRDGIFIFDFSDWPNGCPITIPAYTAEKGKPVPGAVAQAGVTATTHRYNCLAVMNTHLASLSTSWSRVQKTHMPLQQVVTPASHFSVAWSGSHRYLNGVSAQDPNLAYVAASIDFGHDLRNPRRRSVMSLDTVTHSLSLLDKILTDQAGDLQLMVKQLYLAAFQYSEHDFATALTLAWTVSEKLLRTRWHEYIKEQGEEHDATGKPLRILNSDRRKSLHGTAYTASIISEVLSLAGILDHDLYTKLASSRNARNKWLHNLAPISDRMAAEAIQTAQQFIKEVCGIDLSISLSHSSRM